MKFWEQLIDGGSFDLDHPRPEDVSLYDIAHSLSNIGRWTGRTTHFYSVAQHSVMVLEYVRLLGGSFSAQEQALFHDAHEAYTGDIPAPLKALLRALESDFVGFTVKRSAIDLISEDIQWAINRKWQLSEAHHELVKRADNMALWTEREALMAPSKRAWEHEPEKPEIVLPIVPMSHEAARDQFLAAASSLGIS